MKSTLLSLLGSSLLCAMLACSKPETNVIPTSLSNGQTSLNNIVVGSFNQATASLTHASTSTSVWVIVLTSPDTRNTSLSFSIVPTQSGTIPEGTFFFNSFLYDGSPESLAMFWLRDVDPVLHTDYHANGTSLSIKRQNGQYVFTWTGAVRKGLSLADTTTYRVTGQYMGGLRIVQ
ncbi:hypothetical protein GO755_39155 [Spirosoma sp. HMF4905]|uniref:Lipoprotein n=1 Tax=Spirosoma arboris TaxID=2682092 RepID=A0A7K1SQL9_9BACT|nr:hypothetical protein [Spirosoma arboris]MVM36098.1 hypothetical protein [Spirosoma arboris]